MDRTSATDVLTWLEESLEGVPDHTDAHVVVHRYEVQLAIHRLRRALGEGEGDGNTD